MALAAREVHIAAGDDHAVAVEKNIIVDPELGVAAKVENVAVAVDLGGGNVGIAQQQRVVGIGLAPGAEVIINLKNYQKPNESFFFFFFFTSFFLHNT